jgi:hypothetical protein
VVMLERRYISETLSTSTTFLVLVAHPIICFQIISVRFIIFFLKDLSFVTVSSIVH